LVAQTLIWRAPVSSQVKVFFNTIEAESNESITFKLESKGGLWRFNKKSILKLCHIHNYILLRKELARRRGLL
jgi:hypothetical protein